MTVCLPSHNYSRLLQSSIDLLRTGIKARTIMVTLDSDYLYTLESKIPINPKTSMSLIRASLFVSLSLPSNKLFSDVAYPFSHESEPAHALIYSSHQ